MSEPGPIMDEAMSAISLHHKESFSPKFFVISPLKAEGQTFILLSSHRLNATPSSLQVSHGVKTW